MNRRSFLLAPAALATPIALSCDGAEEIKSYEAAFIRERIELVHQTLARGTVAFPETMTQAEIATMRALSDTELETPWALLDFASRWGVSLDWLTAGDVRALIHDARMGRELLFHGGRVVAKK